MYQIAGYPFDLAVSSSAVPELAQKLHAGLKATLKAFESGSPPEEPTPQHGVFYFDSLYGSLACESDTPYHHMRIELFAAASEYPFAKLLQDFEAEIVNQAVREARVHFWIHGACLCRDDETILLVAESGTGKSTLSLGLTQYGYQLITDDIILYDLDDQHFIPMPRCPKIEGDAPSRLAAAGFELSHNGATAESDGTQLEPYILLADKYWRQTPLTARPNRVYFLKRDPDLTPGISESDLSSGLISLLPYSNLIAIDPALSMATEFFAETRFLTIHLNDYLNDLRAIATGT